MRNKQNTPGIIKDPFWQMTYQNPKAVYACVNLGEADECLEKEIVLFEDNGIKLEVPVTSEEETVWLNRAQMAELFDRDVRTIGKHIANARREELEGKVVVANFATTTPRSLPRGF